jgi:hypothetical protein
MEQAARHSAGIALSLTRAAGGVAGSFLAFVAASAEVATTPRSAALLDGARDNVVLGAFVPSAIMPQGEVRLIRRGGAVVMQTVLHTRFLNRAVAEIRNKELASWPKDRAGHEDALRYIDAVLEARNRIQERAGRRGRGGDRRQAMLIEFVLSGSASTVEISEPEVERVNGHLRVVSRRPITGLELSRTYVRGDIYEIARDALGLGEKESKDILEPLLPRESGAQAASSGEKGRKGVDR